MLVWNLLVFILPWSYIAFLVKYILIEDMRLALQSVRIIYFRVNHIVHIVMIVNGFEIWNSYPIVRIHFSSL